MAERPAAGDHGQGIGQAISNGPAALSVHAVLGPLLALAAIGVFVQAIIARHRAVLAAGFIALVAIIGAAFAGTGFVGGTQAAWASMSMAVLTGAAMLCYGLAVYLLPASRRS